MEKVLSSILKNPFPMLAAPAEPTPQPVEAKISKRASPAKRQKQTRRKRCKRAAGTKKSRREARQASKRPLAEEHIEKLQDIDVGVIEMNEVMTIGTQSDSDSSSYDVEINDEIRMLDEQIAETRAEMEMICIEMFFVEFLLFVLQKREEERLLRDLD